MDLDEIKKLPPKEQLEIWNDIYLQVLKNPENLARIFAGFELRVAKNFEFLKALTVLFKNHASDLSDRDDLLEKKIEELEEFLTGPEDRISPLAHPPGFMELSKKKDD